MFNPCPTPLKWVKYISHTTLSPSLHNINKMQLQLLWLGEPWSGTDDWYRVKVQVDFEPYFRCHLLSMFWGHVLVDELQDCGKVTYVC